MLISILLFLVINIFTFELDDNVLDIEIIEKINQDPKSSWKAGINSIFAGKTFRNIQGMMGNYGTFHKSNWNGMKKPEKFVKEKRQSDLPDNYDMYDKYPQCKLEIRNCGQCGSLYAFSPTGIISDRLCQAGHDKVLLSAQDLVSCDKNEYGCNGGWITKTWDYLQNTGVVTESCFPYSSGGGRVEPCPNKCKDSEDWNKVKHKIKSWKKMNSSDEAAMEDLYKYGSFQAFFEGYQDFFAYKSGVYVHKYGSIAGEHLVRVVGWGVDKASGLPYWNCANQWGTDWGMDGYFWILRGSDECGFEDSMYSCIPEGVDEA